MENANNDDPSSHVNERTSKIFLPRNMDVKQLRQLCRKLMKANKTLIVMNEKLYKDKQQIEQQNEQLRNEFGQKLQTLEKENETFKRLLKAEDKLNSVDEILSNTTIEALKTELASQGATSSDDKTGAKDEEVKPSKIPECTQSENDIKQLEMVRGFSGSITMIYDRNACNERFMVSFKCILQTQVQLYVL